jgi:hypothetical protein
MPCPHTTGVRIRPRLSATCTPDAAATVPSMGSLFVSEEPMAPSEEPLAREGSAVPVRGRPPTLSKLSSTEINRLLLFSCSEVAPPLLSLVRVLVVHAAPSSVEVGPSASSPGTETTAMEFPSVSAPVETCITEASHAACSKSVVGNAPVSIPVEVGTAGSSPDVAISVLSSGRRNLPADSLIPLGESSIAASSGSTSGVADRSCSGSLDLSEEPLARVGSAHSTLPSDRCLCGSLDLPTEPLACGGSAVSTVPADRVTLDLSVGMLMIVLETLRLVLCRLGAGSGVPLRGNSSSSMISRLCPWELDIAC